jgi:thiamine-phosphate pyrophosphorylase
MSAPFYLYYITDRTALATEPLEHRISAAVEAGVGAIQIREKDLPPQGLLAFARAAARKARGSKSRILVNDRLDVALASGADGVHLGTQSMPLAAARRTAPKGFLIGASCHSLDQALAADGAGSDYILLGPIFATPSKALYGPPLGLKALAAVSSQVKTPVIALGGITAERVRACLDHGASGIAAIRLFQECDSISRLVPELLREFQAAGKLQNNEPESKSS